MWDSNVGITIGNTIQTGFEVKVTRKGQVTIPLAIRQQAGMPPGTEVEFTVDEAGQVRLRPRQSAAASRVHSAVSALRGRAGRSLSTEEIMALTRG